MKKSKITAEFNADIKTVWSIVTNNNDYSWRSDLSRIEIVSYADFEEYTKQGQKTSFHITHKEPYNRYEFDMKNQKFRGHWRGILESTSNGGTKIEFYEEIQITDPLMSFISFLMPLKKMQKQYIKDLKQKLGE